MSTRKESLLMLLATLVGLLLYWGAEGRSQGIAIPNTFTNNTIADADEVNANFAALAANALNRNAGTLGGALNLNGQNLTGAATFTGVITLSGGQLVFPAVQVPAAGANTFDDYEEGSWTPALTAAVPGDLAITHVLQIGRYVKIGSEVTLWGVVTTSAFTHTTASGDLQITGIPAGLVSITLANFFAVGALQFSGITKANYTQFVPQLANNSTTLRIVASGSGQPDSAVAITEMPSGGTPSLVLQLTYRAAS